MRLIRPRRPVESWNMMALIDFEGCEKSRRFYAGNAGRKIGVVWNGGNWILKFPGPTGRLQGSVPSYTTAPCRNSSDRMSTGCWASRCTRPCWASEEARSCARAGISPMTIGNWWSSTI
ncbi:hypothetical protein DW072_09100 [Bifidobacterium adolescentis]|uniref:Uncharacterized protein n=1 Tax=Bifidobacterium adolescentis TaxID=1680 RepID=A0A415FMH7_BIFAD|nr:hypothetical protein DW072_09100 [Bifidobacterium adolescentis]